MLQPKQSDAAEKEAAKMAEMKRIMQEQKRKQAEQQSKIEKENAEPKAPAP